MESLQSANSFLRSGRWLFARCAYSPEINPWTTRTAMEAVLLFRGAIVAAYGSIETRLAEVAVLASRLEAYASIRASYPHGIAKRLSFFRQAFAYGPLEPFGGIAMPFLDRFEAAGDFRNLIAHGRAETGSHMEDWGVVFHLIQGDPPGLTHRTVRMPIGDLEAAAYRAARLSRTCERLHGSLNQAGVLPTA